MSWESFYLVCFLVGFLFSLLSLVAGAAHVHLPAKLGVHLHFHGHAHAGGGTQLPLLNGGTIAAFLAWFGGTGFLLTRYSTVWALLGLGLAAVSGLGGAAVVFWFLFRVLLPRERILDPADYDMIGVLGTVSSSIREGGTGEMIFSQAGVRRCAAVRSENLQPIPRGTEVVVTRYEKGIAYVCTWDEMRELNTTASK
jgi:membrane protein implicated in regulation of membrane protease activity